MAIINIKNYGTQRLDSLESDVAIIKGNITSINNSIGELDTTAGTIAERVNGAESSIGTLTNKVNKLENNMYGEYVSYTLLQSGWNDGTYSLSSTYPDNEYNVEITISSSATESQVAAYSAALITGSSDSNVLVAKGTVPEEDIPVMLKVIAK